jgi:unsaturated rhamnogalacturonyl hydrolase
MGRMSNVLGREAVVWIVLVAIATGGVAAAPADNGPAPIPPRKEILALMRKVNAWQVANPVMLPDDRNWQRATWYTGVMAAWKATGDRRFLDQSLAWGRRHQWQVGTEACGANRLFCVETWLDLYFLKKDRAMIEPAIRWLKTPAPNSPTGAKRWYLEADYSYVDALYGASALAGLAKATGDGDYAEIMRAFFDDITGELFDKESGLYYRDHRYIGRRTENGRKIFWSRGNGWVFAGIARMLDYLPANDPRRPEYLGIFRRMAAELVRRQGADGLWRPNLDDADHIAVPETSGTGFFCFGLAWGIRNGILDRPAYLPAVLRAWSGLCRNVSSEGKVLWGQQVDGQPNPVKQESTHEYVTGTFLLAGSEAYRLSKAR